MKPLIKDPLSLIVIGVAGQGNVVTSYLICNALVREGYLVTFGQTYPAQPRGPGPMIAPGPRILPHVCSWLRTTESAGSFSRPTSPATAIRFR